MISSFSQLSKLQASKTQTLITMGLYWSLVSLHLVMVYRISSQFDQLVIVGMFWYVFSQRLYQKQTDSVPELPTSLLGYALIACVFTRTFSFYWFDPTFLNAMPFVITCAMALLTVGVKIWQFAVEFLFCGSLLIPLGLITRWFEQGAGIPLQVLTAKGASFLLYYLGLPVVTQGTVIRLPQGAVNVELACTSFAVIFSLAQVWFLLVLLLPLSRRRLIWVFSLTFVMTQLVSIFRVALLAFVVNQPKIFDFWHDSQGQQIISTFLILFLGLTYYFYHLREIDEDDQEEILGGADVV